MTKLTTLIWIMSASFILSQAHSQDIVAHRGIHSGSFEENTLNAILSALNSRSPHVEFDVIRTKDNQLVLNHDYEISPQKFYGLTRKQDLREMNLSEIRKLRHKKDNASIPTLEDLFKAIYENKNFQGITLHLEVKSDTGNAEFKKQFATLLIDIINKYQLSPFVIVRSFDWDIVEAFKKISPEIRRALLVGGMQRVSYWNYRRRTAHSIYNQYEPVLIAPNQSVVNSRMVQTWKEYGVDVNPYTINSIAEAREILRMGASGITTDIPKEMCKNFCR